MNSARFQLVFSHASVASLTAHGPFKYRSSAEVAWRRAESLRLVARVSLVPRACGSGLALLLAFPDGAFSAVVCWALFCDPDVAFDDGLRIRCAARRSESDFSVAPSR